MKNKVFTAEDIRKLKPCYNIQRYVSDGWSGTLLDILDMEDIPTTDRIWVALRLLPKNIVECFAIDCALSADRFANKQDVYDLYGDHFSCIAAKLAEDTITAFSDGARVYAALSAADAGYYVVGSVERYNQIDALKYLIQWVGV